MTLEFIENYISQKISENEEFIRFTYYELRWYFTIHIEYSFFM